MTKSNELYVQQWAQEVLSLAAPGDEYKASSAGGKGLELHDHLTGANYVVEIRVFEVGE